MKRDSTGVVDAWLGHRFRMARRMVGRTLDDIAARMRGLGHTAWTSGTVANVETGKRNITAQELADLCAVHGTTLAYLFSTELFDVSPEGHAIDDFTGGAGEGRTQAMSLIEVDPSRVETPEEHEARKRALTLDRIEKRVFKAVTGRPLKPHEWHGFHEYILGRYGHDLLAERERIESEGVVPQWAGRRIVDELKGERDAIIAAAESYDRQVRANREELLAQGGPIAEALMEGRAAIIAAIEAKAKGRNKP